MALFFNYFNDLFILIILFFLIHIEINGFRRLKVKNLIEKIIFLKKKLRFNFI